MSDHEDDSTTGSDGSGTLRDTAPLYDATRNEKVWASPAEAGVTRSYTTPARAQQVADEQDPDFDKARVTTRHQQVFYTSGQELPFDLRHLDDW